MLQEVGNKHAYPWSHHLRSFQSLWGHEHLGLWSSFLDTAHGLWNFSPAPSWWQLKVKRSPREPGRRAVFLKWLYQPPANHSVLLSLGRVGVRSSLRPSRREWHWLNYWRAGAQEQHSSSHRGSPSTTVYLTLNWKSGHISTQNRQRSSPSWNLHSSGRDYKRVNKSVIERVRRRWMLWVVWVGLTWEGKIWAQPGKSWWRESSGRVGGAFLGWSNSYNKGPHRRACFAWWRNGKEAGLNMRRGEEVRAVMGTQLVLVSGPV